MKLLLPSEWLIVVFLTIHGVAIALSKHTSPLDFAPFAAYPWKAFSILFIATLFLKLKREKAQNSLYSVRRALPFFAITLLYPLVPATIKALGLNDQDAALHQIDLFLFGGTDPLLFLQRLICNPLSEWFALSYSMYGVLLIGLFFSLFLRSDQKPFDRFAFQATFTLGVGYCLYALVPAIGPQYVVHYSIPIDLKYIKDFKEMTMVCCPRTGDTV